ncbi:hypothetical protein GCM10010124_25870 [Pilimelia terevasa]|uniref:Uncharacterized protein n=1 Tax=Pilimelia terevasa TaxID=53372 RepID=A0A8J3BSD9_9ACTN|nr:hypothetical protein [Pilimelia terevasa]GGK31915.1 hypothetical protein GCM10010124_25870 [Pilimelia terevasa]
MTAVLKRTQTELLIAVAAGRVYYSLTAPNRSVSYRDDRTLPVDRDLIRSLYLAELIAEGDPCGQRPQVRAARSWTLTPAGQQYVAALADPHAGAGVDRLARIAAQLVARVREDGPAENAIWLEHAVPSAEDRYALLFVLAAAVPTDRPWRELTAWATRDAAALADEVAVERFSPPIGGGRRRE